MIPIGLQITTLYSSDARNPFLTSKITLSKLKMPKSLLKLDKAAADAPLDGDAALSPYGGARMAAGMNRPTHGGASKKEWLQMAEAVSLTKLARPFSFSGETTAHADTPTCQMHHVVGRERSYVGC